MVGSEEDVADQLVAILQHQVDLLRAGLALFLKSATKKRYKIFYQFRILSDTFFCLMIM
jgi:hypothetical protein